MSELPPNILEMVNAHVGGFAKSIGLHFVSVAPTEVVAELALNDTHLQPYGLVHGGVYSSMIETVCSTGAALSVMPGGHSAVGLENSTSFLRAARSGTLRCVATPQHKGRRSQVWVAEVFSDANRLLATGRVRLIVLESGSEAAGAPLALSSDGPDS